MLGNIGSEGRVAGSLLLFLVEVACQLVWLHVFVFMSCFVYVSRNSVNLFTFSFYSLRSPRCCARLHGCKGAGQRCCQQPFGAPTGACELSYSASSRLRFFLEWVHFCIEFDFVDPFWHCACGSAWNDLQRVILRNISLFIFLGGLNFRVRSWLI